MHEGLILIVYLPCGVKRGCHNGQLLEVHGLPEEGQVLLRDIESNYTKWQPLDFVRDYLRLAYAFTGVGCQGRSLGNEATETEPERGLTMAALVYVFPPHPQPPIFSMSVNLALLYSSPKSLFSSLGGP